MQEESEVLKTEHPVSYTGHKEDYEDNPCRWLYEPSAETLERCAKLKEISKTLKNYSYDNTEHSND